MPNPNQIRIRSRSFQVSPSDDLDGCGDPQPPRWKTVYEVFSGGRWVPIDSVEARKLLAAGQARLVR